MLRVPFSILCAAALACVLAADAHSQTLDLQPGRNFADAVPTFGGGRTEELAAGDADNDGDWDVAVANGGDGPPQANELWINQGGAQAGTEGEFIDGSATRLAGVTLDTSRDIEFVDYDDDGDLDLFVSNRGSTANGGEVSRAYRNQGGLQQGAIGFYSEDTDAFWGTTISIPAAQQLGTPDDFGPWKGFSREGNFADVDDDGDLDLVLVSPGVNLNGQEPTRIFLNDGAGRFDELWPWADDAADVMLHSLDADLADLDGDFDLDLFVSSRDSQARLFQNQHAQGQPNGRLFLDVTLRALIEVGSEFQGSRNYEVELGDLDGDGDFDAWMTNYDSGTSGFSHFDRVLVNDGSGKLARDHGVTIKGDPGIDERDADFFDFDNDGDLDVIIGNWLGTNFIYVSTLADGFTPAQGLYHRTGTTLGDSLAPDPEGPLNGNGSQSNDIDTLDVDGDGDLDVIIGNDQNQMNRLMENVLGVPDSFAPTITNWTDQADKNDGTPTPIHVTLFDNSPSDLIAYDSAKLFVAVDGGSESCLRLRHQGGQQFRGVIPAALSGNVSYRVEVTDDNGNTLVSPTRSYVQSNAGTSPMQSIGCGTTGVNGVPMLQVAGTLMPNAATQITLRHAAPNAFATLFLSVSSSPVPFKQGTLHAFPVSVFLSRSTDAGGLDALDFAWPDTSVFPSGLELWMQYGVQDASVFGAGASLSNAARLEVP
ncbi:MAG: hypothetical protein DHS20C15_13360 [Planctomycetota bacterium]|nr:MAG: hypothetical protein DHS20C15_13360 [Planctomycetota bacterium]